MGGYMSIIQAGNTTTTSLIYTGDTTGNLVFTTGGANTVALTLSNTQAATFANNVTVTGSITATGGVIQGANAAPAFSAYRGSNQTLTQNTYVKIQINTESFDTNNNFDSTTNYRFTPTVAGYYQLNAQMQLNTSSGVLFIALYKNGSQAQASGLAATLSAGSLVSIVSLVYANGSTDYFEIFVYSDNAAPQVNGSTNSFFSGFLARSS
jgi:hypothetical protein